MCVQMNTDSKQTNIIHDIEELLKQKIVRKIQKCKNNMLE